MQQGETAARATTTSGCGCAHATVSPTAILQLPAVVRGLSEEEQQRFGAIYSLEVLSGGCAVPDTFRPKITRWFGQDSDADPAAAALSRVEGQTVLRVLNTLTCEEACFNSLRVSRPQIKDSASAAQAAAALEAVYAETAGPERCDFCAWSERTSCDAWGRVSGHGGCITASNVARAAGEHAVVILPNHHPFDLSDEIVAGVLETAAEWAQRTTDHKYHNNLRKKPAERAVSGRASSGAAQEAEQEQELHYPLVLWNCGFGSGATQPHGHAPAIVTPGRLHGRAELTRRAAAAHRQATGGREYWDDVLLCHKHAGLAVAVPCTPRTQPPTALDPARRRPPADAAAPSAVGGGDGGTRCGCWVLASMTPLVSHELIVLGKSLTDVGRGLHLAMRTLRGGFEARAMSVACSLPPLRPTAAASGEKTAAPSGGGPAAAAAGEGGGWIAARVMDRTDKPTAGGSKFGTMLATWELYGPAVDDVDPCRTAALLREELLRSGARP
jgi:hypothetical protein